jgi:hypothetical protein
MAKIVAGLVLIAAVGLLSWPVAPTLWSDLQLRNQPLVEATDINVSDGKCRTKVFVLSFCEIEFTDAAQSRHSFYYFITAMSSNESFAILRSPQNTALYTTSLGMAYLANRAASFLAGLTILALIVFSAASRRSEPQDA